MGGFVRPMRICLGWDGQYAFRAGWLGWMWLTCLRGIRPGSEGSGVWHRGVRGGACFTQVLLFL